MAALTEPSRCNSKIANRMLEENVGYFIRPIVIIITTTTTL